MAKIELNKKLVEAHFDIKLQNDIEVLGLDTATTTGYCIARTTKTKVFIDVGYFKVDTSNVKQKTLKRRLIVEKVYENLHRIINAPDVVVIEDVYHALNAHTTILLARIGGIAYAVAKRKNIPYIMWRTASEARKALGLKGNAKKQDILDTVNFKLSTNIKNDNEADAMILALNGLKRRK